MTVAAQQTVYTYTAGGGTVFAYGCRILDDDDLIVTVAGVTKTKGVDYNIDGVGADGGGNVTFLVAPTGGASVRLYRQVQAVRTTDYQVAGDFLAPVVNADFDRSVMMVQDILAGAVEMVNAVRVPAGESIPALPAAAIRANTLMAWDGAGNPSSALPAAGTATALGISLLSSIGASIVGWIQTGAGAVFRLVQDKLRERVTPADFGCVGDGVTDDSANMVKAFATGKIVDGCGLTYGITGTCTPVAFGGLIRATLKQLAPATVCRTLYVEALSGFTIRDVTVDRGGSAGYTVGDLSGTSSWSGILINNSSWFRVENVRVTNGGRGTAVAIWNSTDWTSDSVSVSEHYWQEVNPGVPVIVDDILQPWWINACSRFTVSNWRAVNCTSGVAGNPATNVAASAVRNFTRCAWGGNTKFVAEGCIVDNVAQCYDFTGSVGNTDFTVSNCIAANAGVSGFKFANHNSSVQVIGCVAKNPNQYGFLISGMSDAATPVTRDIEFIGCLAVDTGGLSAKYAGNTYGFAVESQGAFDITYPRAVTFTRCSVIDRQVTPTTTYAFRTNVAALQIPTAGYDKPHTIRAIECKVDVPGMAVANKFSGFHTPLAVVIGGAGTDACTTAVWTALTLDGTEWQDASGLHNSASSPDTVTIKEDGLYVIKGRSAFAANATGSRFLRLLVNGGSVEDIASVLAHPTGKTWVWDTWFRFLYAGDAVKLQGLQDSGGPLNVTRADTVLSLVKVC